MQKTALQIGSVITNWLDDEVTRRSSGCSDDVQLIHSHDVIVPQKPLPKEAKAFLEKYKPAKQYVYCTGDLLERCYIGTAPTLKEVTEIYGENAKISWISIQIHDLAKFAGVKEKPTEFQLGEIARLVSERCHFIKVTELMHFFLKLKSGDYGRFFGAVDGMFIMAALNEYIVECVRIREAYRLAAEKAKRVKDDEADMKRVKAFYSFLNDRHITLHEYQTVYCEMGITEWAEIDALYWLLRIY